MKTRISVSLVGAILLISSLAFSQQTNKAENLYQEALMQMEGRGNFSKALEIFGQIIKDFPVNRQVSAKAQFQIGVCYEKLGKSEAQKAYEKVIKEFADQREVVAEARTRLQALTRDVSAAAKPTTTVRQVWAGSDVDVLGAPSSDGKYLSFVDWETGDLAVRDLVTGQKRRLTNKGSWSESIEFALSSMPSPDGKQIAYTWLNKDLSYDLRLVQFDGGEPKVLYRNEEVAYLQPGQWSKDGKQILALISRKDLTNQIALVSEIDGAVRVLKTLDWRYPLKMSLSPDGRFVAYDFPPQEKSPTRDIFLLATDGSREIPIVQHSASDLFPVWAPDGKRIIFASDRTGALGLWSLAVVNGKSQVAPELVKADIGRMSPLGFTDKGALYYSLQTGMTDVYTAAFDFSAGRLLESPAAVSERFVGSNRHPDWSPDGKYLSYVSQRGSMPPQAATAPIIIRTLATGEEREIVPAVASSRHTRWWLDGRAFVIASEDAKGRKGIYRVDAQTGATSLLVPLEPAAYSPIPAWSPDGKQIFYTYPKGNELVLRMRNLESGQEKELYRDNAYTLAVSPDGHWLAFTAPGHLMILPIAGDSLRELLQVQPPESIPYSALAWTPDGKYLLFVKGQPQKPASLWRIPAQGGEPLPLGLTMEGLTSVRVHPDGRRIAFTAGKNMSEVWVMENFLSRFTVPLSKNPAK